jgi:hypothetical protein
MSLNPFCEIAIEEVCGLTSACTPPHKLLVATQPLHGHHFRSCVLPLSPRPSCVYRQGVRLKEKKFASEVVAVTIGPKAAQETLRTALAMGADRAIHIETDVRTDQELHPLTVAKLLKFVTNKVSAPHIEGKRTVHNYVRLHSSAAVVVYYECTCCFVRRKNRTCGSWASRLSTTTATRLVRCVAAALCSAAHRHHRAVHLHS